MDFRLSTSPNGPVLLLSEKFLQALCYENSCGSNILYVSKLQQSISKKLIGLGRKVLDSSGESKT
jgi:hypothetical protein